MKVISRIRRLFPSREEWRTNRRALLLCLASGLCGALIFNQNALGALAWAALAPYFFALRSLRGKMIAWGTFIFGLPWYYLSLWWINTIVVFNPFIPVGVVILAAIQTVYFLWFAYPAALVLKRAHPAVSPFLLGAMWAGMEYIRTFTDLAFPWNFLAHSQVPDFLWAIQSADRYGVYGVSFAIALVNAFVAEGFAWRRSRPASRKAFAVAAIALLLVMAHIVMDVRKAVRLAVTPADTTLRIAVIQPNISQLDKWDAYSAGTPQDVQQEILSRMFRVTTELMQSVASEEPRLYILPETAFAQPWFVYDTLLHNTLAQYARQLNADIFFGADSVEAQSHYLKRLRAGFRDPSPDLEPTKFTLPTLKFRLNDQGTTEPYESERMVSFNSAWLVTPEEGLSSRVYSKVQLVPFGETAPIVNMIPYFQEKIMMVGSFQKGLEFTTFETDGVKYGPLICFESAFGALGRGVARSGAQFLCVLTNDGWYDPAYADRLGSIWGKLFQLPGLKTLATAGPRQHLAHSYFRAVETRMPVVRVANTGISSIITPSGMVMESRGFGAEAAFVHDLGVPRHHLTFYAKYGDWFAQLCLVIVLCTIGYMGLIKWTRNEEG